MPYIPHTAEDTSDMLTVIGKRSLNDLFSEIPESLKKEKNLVLPDSYTEPGLVRLLEERANKDLGLSCFAGAGAYEHYIPSVVWSLASRGEFYSAYTPYQAEASQGTLQLLYEYQSMIAALTGMDVANASVYDGATALVESVFMAARIQKKLKNPIVLVPETLSPLYYQTLKTFTQGVDIELRSIPVNKKTGQVDLTCLQAISHASLCALIVPQITFHGVLEDVSALTDWAHLNQLLVIGVVNPIALGMLLEPGSWGVRGADIVCGEGQPLGIPLSSGGPYFGFMTTYKRYIRELPGRLVAKTQDSHHQEGYVLTLQAREQHIRRAKAKSNICTNQGLMVTAATIYLASLGAEGLKNVAEICHVLAKELSQNLIEVAGVSLLYTSDFFHEFAVCLPCSANLLIKKMSQLGFFAGLSLGEYNSELSNVLLICVTETKTRQDLQNYVRAFVQCCKEQS